MDYNEAKEAILSSLILGLDVEGDSTMYLEKGLDSLTDEQLGWIASWLASEGFSK